MALQADEVTPGAIAYLDVVQSLNADQTVTKSGTLVNRPGCVNQFVCYQVLGTQSSWAPLTGSERPERLHIDPAWVVNGYGALAAGQVWLQDGRNTYRGPTASFVAAAGGEQPFHGGRPRINAAGLQQIIATIQQRGGQL